MRLAILGGGGFRVPLVYGVLLRDTHERRVDEVVLYDVDPQRLAAIASVLHQMAADSALDPDAPPPPRVLTTTDLDTALSGVDFVFSAIRVGGLRGRTCDERVALDLGVLGQETAGPGGLAYGLRTLPVAMDIAARARRLSPNAWVINFTNPAGMITQAMQSVLGPRVIGICDSPLGLGKRAARALGREADVPSFDYAGLNHLGWLRALQVDGADALPALISDDALLQTTEEGRLFGTDWLQSLGAIPNEYLYYYYFTRDAVAAIRGSAETRGEFLLHQQSEFYAAVAADPGSALAIWRRTREERDATYMKEAREEGEERDAADIAGGGYEGVALALMAAIARGEPSAMILNVANGATLPGLPGEAVIEVPCVVDATGPRALPVSPLTGHMLGLCQQVKAVEGLTIQAATSGDPRTAVAAFALHPLVDSVTTARLLVDGYRAALPELARLFPAG